MTEYAMNGQVVTGVWKKYLGWITVSLLVAFLTNNFLNIYFGFEGLSSLFAGFSFTGRYLVNLHCSSLLVSGT